MLSMRAHVADIENILYGISDTFNLDAAVIDDAGYLIASTPRYVQRKGRRVHTPFIQRVFDEGLVLVDSPGLMSQCSGCRFSMHCPATIELLACVRLGTATLGVVTLTSFTKSGRERLAKNLDRYRGVLETLGELITSIVQQEITVPDHETGLLGSSLAMSDLRQVLHRVSTSRSSVLIQGETGTGKGLVARSLHLNSNRRLEPFVVVNCASIPEGLFESELFGYEEGAFTGARKHGKPGRFELANGGTLFLDEIGELPFHLQSKLLRVLQEGLVDRVGGTHPVPIDVRIVAATNQDLDRLVAENKFRADLYYRLNVIPVHILPLRDRPEDIPAIASHHLQRLSKMNGKHVIGISDEAQQVLQDYHWPGNVRELENALEYAVTMEDTQIIQRSNLPAKLLERVRADHVPLRQQRSDVELAQIRAALDKYGYDVKGKQQAAKELGIGLRTLYRRLQAR